MTCETIDGNCPNCANFQGDINFNAVVIIKPTVEMIINTLIADYTIIQNADIKSFQPLLHLTLFYFCCQNISNINILLDSLHSFKWNSIEVNADTIGCNLDRDNETIYIHALPTFQTKLFNLTQTMQKVIVDAGGVINHPRESLFHITLARVKKSYPISLVINSLQDKKWNFGSFNITQFSIFLFPFLKWETFYALDF